MSTLEGLQAVGRGMRITTKHKLTAACGATFEEQRVLDGHERLCLTCQQLRAGRPEMVSPLAMQDDFIDPDDLLLYDAGAADGFIVSRRFRVVNKPCDFWQLASSATVSGVARDYVVQKQVVIPAELLSRLYDYVANYLCCQSPSAPTKLLIREDLDAVLGLFVKEKVWSQKS